MSDLWKIGPGKIENRSSLGFVGKWCSGAKGIAEFSGSCWSNKGASEDDTIHIYAIQWLDVVAPDRKIEASLMREAFGEIDDWINLQM